MKKKHYPHISIRAILYTLRVYHKAVGARSIFFAFCRLFDSVLPSVTAVLSGVTITEITKAIGTQNFTPVIVLIIVLLGLQTVKIILDTIERFLSARTHEEVYAYVSERISMKYLQVPLYMRESREFADRFERVKNFTDSISSTVTYGIISVFSSTIGLISIFVATLTISPIITIIVVLSAVPSSILTIKLSARYRRNWREYTKDRRIAWNIEKKILDSNSALEIEVNGLGGHLIKRMVRHRRRSQEQDVADERRYLWPRFGADMFETATTYGILTFVAFEIVFKGLEIGQFFTIRTLLTELSSGISLLFTSFTSASDNLINASDFMEFMNTPIKSPGDIKISSTPTIEFKGVSFSYPNATVKALDNISFKINPGESLAIVGENGAGKTTIIKLLIGAYEPSEGTILINNYPLSEIDRESFLAQIGALFQEFSRYEFATLGENVWFGDTSKKYNKKAIRTALEQADLATLPSKYEKGLDQILSKDYDAHSTADLSGGQWQRLAVARALFRSPNILLLDEPTSAIDAKSENKIFQNIFEAQKGKTTIIISHRFSTVRKANNIIVLERGKLIEAGTHEELVAKKQGVYKTLFEAQAKGYA